MKILMLSSIIGMVRSLIIIVPLLLLVAYLTLLERKVLGGMQRRTGPNVVGFSGLLQPFADGLKLLSKETVIPSLSNKIIFIIAPIGTFFLSLLGWAVIPLGPTEVLSSINIGILYLLAISSLGVYGIIMSGWSSNSKYAFLGGLRSAAQMISYEVSLGLIILSVILCSGSLDLTTIVRTQKYVWYCFPLLSLLAMFFISCLAETNRPPFDLPEAEAELVSGFNVEYAAAGFALFFIGEYVNIILMSTLCAILFLGGGFYTLGIKVLFFVFLFLWVRVAFPRYRYDQLMRLGWKIFLPLSLGILIGISGHVILWDSLIINI